MLLRRPALAILFIITILNSPAAHGQDTTATRLLRNPAISQDHIAFVYANDLWVARHDGSEARRLTTHPGLETDPYFSPDGQTLAFTGQYDGNIDVYTVSVQGGAPERMTWHPGEDLARGWTPDSTGRILLASDRARAPLATNDQFWTLDRAGALPQPFRVPRVTLGQHSPDGERFAYQPVSAWESEWRNYRGGQNGPIRIIELETLEEEKVPWDGSNDKNPVWIGNIVYFLSDRNYTMNVWSFNPVNKQVEQQTFFKEFDCKHLASGGGKLVFECGGYLYLLTSTKGEPQRIDVRIDGDFAWARPHWAEVQDDIREAGVSPTGQRAVFEARGDIFTVPAKEEAIRNLTQTSGVAERSPAWSPDGEHISWFSDAGGEYQLVIADQYGENRKTIALDSPTFYYTPVWSPDSKHLSFSDANRTLWVVEVNKGTVTQIDNEGFANPERTLYPTWSPDSRWLAYTRQLDNEYNAIFVYSLRDERSYQLTDGMSDSRAPAWDAGGKYLYFLASTNYGLNVGWLDMSSIERPLDRAVYAVVLSADDPSPVRPKSDEEAEEEKRDDNKKTPRVFIDLPNIRQRIVALDIPVRSYTSLQSGEAGTLFFTESIANEEGLTLHRHALEDQETKKLMSNVQSFYMTADGQKLLYETNEPQWGIVEAGADPEALKSEPGTIDVKGMRAYVDPVAEWKQIFREAWRYQRDYFYVRNVHGLDMDWAYATYAPWIDHVRHRSDLTYVLDILGGETAVGHSFVRGGSYPEIDQVPIGMLGADFTVTNGYYRIDKVYNGENWNPELRAPLSAPGVNVQAGEYLLAINGRPLDANTNVYSRLAYTADQPTRITINSEPTLKGARELTVVPVEDEAALRRLDWVEGNRRRVNELSDGKLAYVWLPNTAGGGYRNFNRYYFAQQDKQGAIIDERFNTGGFAADYIVDLLSRELMGYFSNPIGDKTPFTSPGAGIWGPKVMLINEMSGSGGDYLPYMFKKKGIGPLVGTRTWGGLVGIWDVPPLVDGGTITAPRGGFFNTEGAWDVENVGTAPDTLVEQTPRLVATGRDPQLEKAVEVALELLEKNPVQLMAQPPDPVRVRRPEEGE